MNYINIKQINMAKKLFEFQEKYFMHYLIK